MSFNNTEFNPLLIDTEHKLLMKRIEDLILEQIDEQLNFNTKHFIVYISGPVTNIDNYNERFEEVVSFLKSDRRFKNTVVINPMRIFDQLDSDDPVTNYLLCINIIRKYVNCLILDDRSDEWKNSKGAMIELSAAINKRIDIYSLKSLIEGEV